MRLRWGLLCLVASTRLCLLAEAKVHSAQVRLGGAKKKNRWKYVTKFGYATGLGSYSFRVRLYKPRTLYKEAPISLEVHLDEEWPETEQMSDPCERPKRARTTKQIPVPPKGEWGEWVNGTLRQTMRPHIWYFVLSDCNSSLPGGLSRLRFEFRANQEDGSEFSVEMAWMLPVNLIYFLGFSIFIWTIWKRTSDYFRSAGSVHPMIWILCVGVAVQYLAQSFHTFHLWVYRYTGYGVYVLDVIAGLLHIMAQVLQATLYILLAYGYTLVQSKLGDLDLLIPIGFMVLVIHLIIVGVGKIQDDASYKFHENEGIIGWVLLIFRLCLYGAFLYGVRGCTRPRSSMNVRRFLDKLTVAGSLYFLAYPILFVVTQQLAPYWQHCIMASGLMVMQMCSNVWLQSLFLQRGEYFKVSTLNSSMLPGGARVGLDKEE